MPILALEASTSSAKAMLWDLERGLLAVEQLPYPADACDGMTFVPRRVVESVMACGAALLGHHPKVAVEAIGLSSIWHSLVVLDGEKNPIGPGFTWADTSPAPTVADFRADREFTDHFYQTTGCALHSSFNIFKWLHLRQTADTSAVRHVSCLPEYLFDALTDQLAVSLSCAAGSGFLNSRTLDWDPDLLRLAGTDRSMLGNPVEPHYSLPLTPQAANALGLPTGLPVTVAGPDGALNHIAAGGLGSPAMTLSVGTSGAIRMAHKGPAIPEKQSTWCYYGAEGQYIIGAATSGAGNCVNWFMSQMPGGSAGFSAMEEAAILVKPENTPYFLPFLFGERCPGWDDKRRGGFSCLSGTMGTGELYRSLLEGILFNLYQNYQILVDVAGTAPERIGISGGITQSPFWTQLAADIFSLPVEENTGEHASLLGAAYVAAKAVGMIPALAAIPEARGKRHEPDAKAHEVEMERFQNWLLEYKKG